MNLLEEVCLGAGASAEPNTQRACRYPQLACVALGKGMQLAGLMGRGETGGVACRMIMEQSVPNLRLHV